MLLLPDQFNPIANAQNKVVKLDRYFVLEILIADEVAVTGKMHRREDVVARLSWLTATVPDHVWKIEDLFPEGERIAVRLRDKEHYYHGRRFYIARYFCICLYEGRFATKHRTI